MDQALIANEAIEDYGSRTKAGVLLKIDFEKAYDHVDWDFLDKVLEKKGFDYKWRMQMWVCMRVVSYSFLINGSSRGRVVAIRGVRQGDPLSPFLFLLVVDVKSRIVSKCVEGTFEVGEDKVALSHLQFTDDTLFFYSGNEDSFCTSNHILTIFEEISGFRINRGKFSVMGINCERISLNDGWRWWVARFVGSLLLALVSHLEATPRWLPFGT